MEEKSRILCDAFIRIEKPQIQKTAHSIEKLDSTVAAKLRSYVFAPFNHQIPNGTKSRRKDNTANSRNQL